MEFSIVPVFSPTPDRRVSPCEGTRILTSLEALDEVAAVNGLRPLSSFTDNREVPEDFHGTTSELDAILGEWAEWFEIEDGLAVVGDLIHALESDPANRSLLPEPARTKHELRELERCLERAENHTRLFRLEIH